MIDKVDFLRGLVGVEYFLSVLSLGLDKFPLPGLVGFFLVSALLVRAESIDRS